MLRYVPSILILVRDFIMNRCWILSNAFCASMGIIWLLSFFFFVNVVYHTDFSAYVEASLQPSNESNLIMVYDSFYVFVGFGLLIFCWDFLHLYLSKIMTYNFLFCCVCLILISGWWWLHRMNLGMFPSLQSFRIIWKAQV